MEKFKINRVYYLNSNRDISARLHSIDDDDVLMFKRDKDLEEHSLLKLMFNALNFSSCKNYIKVGRHNLKHLVLKDEWDSLSDQEKEERSGVNSFLVFDSNYISGLDPYNSRGYEMMGGSSSIRNLEEQFENVSDLEPDYITSPITLDVNALRGIIEDTGILPISHRTYTSEDEARDTYASQVQYYQMESERQRLTGEEYHTIMHNALTLDSSLPTIQVVDDTDCVSWGDLGLIDNVTD